MSQNDQDIESILKERLSFFEERAAYFSDQVAKARTALNALKGRSHAEVANDGLIPEDEDGDQEEVTYPWAASIDELFDKYKKLSVKQVRNKLVHQGLPAKDDKYADTVQATILRKYRTGQLDRVSKGVYKKKIKRVPGTHIHKEERRSQVFEQGNRTPVLVAPKKEGTVSDQDNGSLENQGGVGERLSHST